LRKAPEAKLEIADCPAKQSPSGMRNPLIPLNSLTKVIRSKSKDTIIPGNSMPKSRIAGSSCTRLEDVRFKFLPPQRNRRYDCP
jgi:hypothetical protein